MKVNITSAMGTGIQCAVKGIMIVMCMLYMYIIILSLLGII